MRLSVQVVGSVPLSITAIDPTIQEQATLVITPVVTKEISAERPHIMVTWREHRHLFEYYWNDLEMMFARATHLP
jgi:hypothetical protein